MRRVSKGAWSWSERKYAMAFGLSARTAKRILHLDLKFHPFKMMMAKESLRHDFQNCLRRSLVSFIGLCQKHNMRCKSKTIWCTISADSVVGP